MRSSESRRARRAGSSGSRPSPARPNGRARRTAGAGRRLRPWPGRRGLDLGVLLLDFGLPLPRRSPLRCESETRPPQLRRARSALLREDDLCLGLHIFEDRVDLEGRPGSRQTPDRRRSRRTPGWCRGRGTASRLAPRERLRAPSAAAGCRATVSTSWTAPTTLGSFDEVGRPAPRRCRSGRAVPWRLRHSSELLAIIQPSIGASTVSVPNSGFISGQTGRSRGRTCRHPGTAGR